MRSNSKNSGEAPISQEKEATTIQTVRQKIIEFEAAQESFREYGAGDTEPDSVFQKLLDDIVRGKAPKIPRTVDEWELYTTLPGASVAAKVLCMIATEIAIEIENLPLRYQKELEELVHKTCWRLY